MGRRQAKRYFAEVSRARAGRVLVPLASLAEAQALLPVAEAIVHERGGFLLVLLLPLPSAEEQESLAGWLASRSCIVNLRATTAIPGSAEAWDEVWQMVEAEGVDVLVLGWPSVALPRTAVGEMENDHLRSPPCEVVLVRPAPPLTRSEGWQEVRRILLPVRGGPHAALALRVANTLAETVDADITLLHVRGRPASDAEERLFTTFASTLRSLNRVSRAVSVIGSLPGSILEEAAHHHIVVMGASARPVAGSGWRGPILDAVAKDLQTTLIVTKERRIDPLPSAVEQEPMLPSRQRPAAVVVDRWFATNTFHCTEFADLESLVAAKEEQGVTISLGLPALNEEETVGNVIQTLKRALMEEVPLLDEMVLIDSGSVDYTREIAADLGIPVYIHQEILPQYGSYSGKGEALWKSLYVLRGDLIAWIDTDIVNIHPRFVYGLLGPLLRRRDVDYVKGFYRRPLHRAGILVGGGGGRVTELTARPFINLFFPELSGVLQPLSGEYGGRREVLEQLPFFTGYGVETGLLIDVLEARGLRAIAQVDLLERIHRNQPLSSLSKMAFAIIQVFVRRLEDRRKIHLLEEMNKTMNLVRYEVGQYRLEVEEIRERERPPMLSLPEYREKRGLNRSP